jgi:hypothetical protein
MSRAYQIAEAIDSLLLRPTLRDAFLREKNKFRHQSSRTPISHMTRVARELVDTSDFDPATNPWTKPTCGQDAQPSWYDLHPQQRWAPVFKRSLATKMKEVQEVLLEASSSPKKEQEKSKGHEEKKGPPAFLLKKKHKKPDQEEVQQQDQEQTLQNKQAIQQQNRILQQQGVPPEQLSPQDALQGGLPPDLPELPRDVRKDPQWIGNRSAGIIQGLQSFSQKIVDRYDLEKDPLQHGGPRTNVHRLLRQQTRWGDATNRLSPRTNGVNNTPNQ